MPAFAGDESFPDFRCKPGEAMKRDNRRVGETNKIESLEVSPEEKRLLLESIAQANRGEFVDVDELLAELDGENGGL